MLTLLLIILLIAATWVILYQRYSLLSWTIASVVILIVFSLLQTCIVTLTILWILIAVIAVIFNFKSLRCSILTRSFFKVYKRIMPNMSSTEKEALAAGCITWEAEMFAGKPDWKKLLDTPAATLSEDEKAFIEGPLQELCSMIDDWDITHNRHDLPPEVWQFIKEKGFFSFIIPKEYGGLGFKPYAISRILLHLYSCSVSVASTVGVPNSLGPGELLLHYGTEEQKKYYLPRLASGQDVPCFALTGTEAGSDAASLSDSGVICKGEFDGKEVIGIRLNFDKRYITLAPIASLVGLAFKLYDPEHLIGEEEDYGITCALIPRDTAGMIIGRRHFPVNQAFMNGPVSGKDVFIPLDWIIGGKDMAGQGWRMLMECLAAGRAVTLPSSGVAAGVQCSHATGAYAHIRKQFNLPVGRFEGVEEAMARIGGNTYMMDAGLCLTMDYLNQGKKSAVAAAICKYHITELGRVVINDAMDVHGGKGIQMGPKNYLARAYEGQPIAITVEGANILTRSLIIYGQGAIRCHPYVLSELEAAQNDDLKMFDTILWKHVGYVMSNLFRTLWMGLTNARFVKAPTKGPSKRYFQIMTRYSSALALCSDIAMFRLGGALKRKEKLSGRLGDILSYLYLGSGVAKRFKVQGEHKEDAPLMHWASRELIYRSQEALHNLLRNFPGKLLPWLLRIVIFPFGRLFSSPLDKYGRQIADIMLYPSEARDRLTASAYIPDDVEHNMGLLKITLQKVVECEPLTKAVHQAYKKGIISGDTLDERIVAAAAADVITDKEKLALQEMQRLTKEVVAVDDFSNEELSR
jgi:acyl-CoA dehydrogenase